MLDYYGRPTVGKIAQVGQETWLYTAPDGTETPVQSGGDLTAAKAAYAERAASRVIPTEFTDHKPAPVVSALRIHTEKWSRNMLPEDILALADAIRADVERSQ